MLRRLLPLFFCSTVAFGCASTGTDEVGSGTSDLTSSGEDLGALRAAVKNVDEEHVVLAASIAAPAADPSGGTKSDAASLSGLDWYQKWAGGKTADHTWSDGSAHGKRCAWASALRFEAIFADPPAELAALLGAQSQWTGTFQNWNNDYAGTAADGKPAYGDAAGAYVFAPRADVTKWVSATAKDGSCYLPTRAMVLEYLATCRAQVAAGGGIKGCQAPAATDD